jgi:hypothetical protein
MASTFAWLDHSEEQRRRVLDVVSMFKEKSTVDELGIGIIRDAFSDLLFPGTSAPQTRARYFLFIPWLYLRLEAAHTSSVEVAVKARREELRLAEYLLASGESAGVIGRLAKKNLQRLPSNIYWSGLQLLGVCRFEGSQETYHRSLDAFYRRTRSAVRNDDGELDVAPGANWHGVPRPPAGFPEQVSLALTQAEAEYLRDRLAVSVPRSLFAHLVRATPPGEPPEFPWGHPSFSEFPEHNKEQLLHAQNFSELMHGAALLYNLILAEASKNPELIARYEAALTGWRQMVDGRIEAFGRWDQPAFWTCVQSGGGRVGPNTRAFVARWWTLALTDGNRHLLSESRSARELIANREIYLKGPLARVKDKRALERWGGGSGTGRMDYRWPNAYRIANDILSALEPAGHA